MFAYGSPGSVPTMNGVSGGPAAAVWTLPSAKRRPPSARRRPPTVRGEVARVMVPSAAATMRPPETRASEAVSSSRRVASIAERATSARVTSRSRMRADVTVSTTASSVACAGSTARAWGRISWATATVVVGAASIASGPVVSSVECARSSRAVPATAKHGDAMQRIPRSRHCAEQASATRTVVAKVLQLRSSVALFVQSMAEPKALVLTTPQQVIFDELLQAMSPAFSQASMYPKALSLRDAHRSLLLKLHPIHFFCALPETRVSPENSQPSLIDLAVSRQSMFKPVDGNMQPLNLVSVAAPSVTVPMNLVSWHSALSCPLVERLAKSMLMQSSESS